MKKPPDLIQTPSQLAALRAAHMPIETFGPGTDRPFIAFDLTDSNKSLGPWLRDLPCPVIGIGTGPAQASCDVILENTARLPGLQKSITRAPLAAMVLVQHLRVSETLSMPDGLTAESFAYATLQTGPEFNSWLETYSGKPLPKSSGQDVTIDVSDSEITVTLNRPDTRNAIGTDMRDALCEALDLALITDAPRMTLMASGKTFSTGGAIEEFGEVSDPATAHHIRSLRLPAWRLARLGSNLHVHVNGAAIGAGAEIAAFGTRVTASSNAWFQLPELKYGLIPGAGGTVSITRRIGRQKTAYMGLSGAKIRARTALEWGLVDAIID